MVYKQYKISLDKLEGLTPDDQERLIRFEKAQHEEAQEQAMTKDRKRAAWIAAGGTAESFEDHWKNGGEREHLARRAEEIEEYARRSSVFSGF